jgi:nucleoid-associated protein YgaU
MKRMFLVFGFWFLVIGITGCVVRTYQVTKDRIDQDLTTGNRGYLKGQNVEVKERKPTRTIQAVEIELHSPIKFETMPKSKLVEKPSSIEKAEDQELWGNRGYITQSYNPEPLQPETAGKQAPANIERYTVQKGDTLQKISKKFYGTTKKWTKIYDANKDILKGPNKIYPKQVISIPVEPLKESKENLK